MKILVTGGPVYAYLDAVKIITNRFRGGFMAELADTLAAGEINRGHGNYVTYLCAKNAAKPPRGLAWVKTHDGFHDYRAQVLEMAPDFDAIILGAAVCNLIPSNPLKGKFPSHNYRVGDTIDIPFTIAPRVVDEVKAKMKPGAHLFAYKLLSGAPHEELIEAAYEVLLASKATCVIANDATDLTTKYVVTKERAVHKLNAKSYPHFIFSMMQDTYYHTEIVSFECPSAEESHGLTPDRKERMLREIGALAQRYSAKFQKRFGSAQYVFGTVAIRDVETRLIVTTARGKREVEDFTFIMEVDHARREVLCYPKKPTLNAPLLDSIFKQLPDVHAVVHYHDINSGLPKLDYAPPGTVRDLAFLPHSFEIESHGVFLLLRKDGSPILQSDVKLAP